MQVHWGFFLPHMAPPRRSATDTPACSRYHPPYRTHNLDQQLLTHYASPRSGDVLNDMTASPTCCVVDPDLTKTMTAPRGSVPFSLTPDWRFKLQDGSTQRNERLRALFTVQSRW